MIDISQAVKDAFNSNGGSGARFVEWSVRLDMLNNEAIAQIVPAASEDPLISRIAQTKNYETDPLKIQTYEYMGFPLDGTGRVPPRVTEAPEAEVGLIMPEMSDENGLFTAPQIYTAITTDKFNLIAITLSWGYTVAADFTVEWYSDGTIVHSETVTGNMLAMNLFSTAVSDVNKIIVTVTRTLLPHRRVRIAECLFGAILLYNRENSDSLNVEEVADGIGERVMANKMTLITNNFARQFNIFDPAGIYSYFQTRMLMNVKIGTALLSGSVEYVNFGQYYLKAPSLKGNLAKVQLEATSIIGVLQDTVFSKGIYKTATLAQFIEDVAGDVDVMCVYPAGFSAISMPAYFSTMSHAQAFRLIAQASNTLLMVDRESRILFKPLGTGSMQTIGEIDYRMSNGFAPSDDNIINTVNVEFASLSVEASASELASVPAAGSITASVFYADNAVITTTAGTYAVKYAPSTAQTAAMSGGKLIVSGKRIINSGGVVSVTIKQGFETAYVYEVKGNLFIQSENAQNVASYLLQRKAQKRRSAKIEYPGYPYFEMGDIIDFDTGSDQKTQPFFVTKNSLKLGGGMVGTMEARER